MKTRTGQAPTRIALVGAIVLLASGCAWVRQVSSPAAGGGGTYGEPALSADARYVAYGATRDGADPSALNAVFLLDALTNTRELVSVSSSGEPANDWSGNPAISADGRFVAFASDADNLVAGDTNVVTDVFLRDRVARTTARVSVTSTGAEVADPSDEPAISANGLRIAFVSDSDDLDPLDNNGSSDVYVQDRGVGTTKIASIGAGSLLTDFGAWDPAISSDGNVVGFTTDTALVTADLNDSDDVYVRVLSPASTQWISKPRGTSPDGGGGDAPALNANGSLVAFGSLAPDLPDGMTDTMGQPDVFVRNRTTATTERVSVSPTGAILSGQSFQPTISSDGTKVLFTSTANASGTDVNGAVPDVFVRNRVTARTVLASTAAFLDQSGETSLGATLSPDGRYLAWQSPGAYVAEDGNGLNDVYLRAIDVPKLTSISPVTIARGATVTLTINGDTFLTGAIVIVEPGLTAGPATVTATKVTVSITAAPGATPGKYQVVVQNPGTGPGFNTGAVGQCKDCLTVT